MVPGGWIRAMGMVFLAWGAFGASDIAIYFDEPFIALGYALSGLAFIGASIRSLFQPF